MLHPLGWLYRFILSYGIFIMIARNLINPPMLAHLIFGCVTMTLLILHRDMTNIPVSMTQYGIQRIQNFLSFVQSSSG